jgi:hypothetical protein
VRPLCARWPFRGLRATPKAIPRAPNNPRAVAAASRLHLRVHALTIHIEVPEIGRWDPTPKRLLCALRAPAGMAFNSRATPERLPERLQGESHRRPAPMRFWETQHLSRLPSCPNNPHRGGRNWSGANAFRPPSVRLPSAFRPPSVRLRRSAGGQFSPVDCRVRRLGRIRQASRVRVRTPLACRCTVDRKQGLKHFRPTCPYSG